MGISEENIKLFEDYLAGKLSEQERISFDAKLAYDSDFNNEFDAFQEMEMGIKQHFRNELKNKLIAVDEDLSYKEKSLVSKIIIWSSSIAAILIVGFFIANYLGSTSKNIELANQYWPYEEGLPVTMAEKGIYDEAMNAFKQEQWQKAEDLLVKINSDTANYYLGIINYEQKDYNNSVTYFLEIPATSHWAEESEFRLALVYLTQHKINKTKEVLNQIKTSDTYYAKQSVVIFKKL